MVVRNDVEVLLIDMWLGTWRFARRPVLRDRSARVLVRCSLTHWFVRRVSKIRGAVRLAQGSFWVCLGGSYLQDVCDGDRPWPARSPMGPTTCGQGSGLHDIMCF